MADVKFLKIGTSGQLKKNETTDNLSLNKITLNESTCAPLVVTSTAKVANLNVDLLNGKNESSFLLVNGTRPMSANLSMQDGVTKFKIINLADPDGDNDAATKAYVNAVVQGLLIKDAVRITAVTALPAWTTPDAPDPDHYQVLTGTANGIIPNATADNRALVLNDRIVIKDETDQKANGIWYVFHVGVAGPSGSPWVLKRPADSDGLPEGELRGGVYTFTTDGDINAKTGWAFNKPTGPIVVGTDNIEITQFSGAGSYVAGDAIYLNGTEINVLFDNTTIGLNSCNQLEVISGSISASQLANDINATSINFHAASADSATNALALCGCVPSNFMSSSVTCIACAGYAATAGDASTVGGCSPSCFMSSSVTCIACAGNANTVGGCSPSCFMSAGTTCIACAGCAGNSGQLGGLSASDFLRSCGGTLSGDLDMCGNDICNIGNSSLGFANGNIIVASKFDACGNVEAHTGDSNLADGTNLEVHCGQVRIKDGGVVFAKLDPAIIGNGLAAASSMINVGVDNSTIALQASGGNLNFSTFNDGPDGDQVTGLNFYVGDGSDALYTWKIPGLNSTFVYNQMNAHGGTGFAASGENSSGSLINTMQSRITVLPVASYKQFSGYTRFQLPGGGTASVQEFYVDFCDVDDTRDEYIVRVKFDNVTKTISWISDGGSYSTPVAGGWSNDTWFQIKIVIENVGNSIGVYIDNISKVADSYIPARDFASIKFLANQTVSGTPWSPARVLVDDLTLTGYVPALGAKVVILKDGGVSTTKLAGFAVTSGILAGCSVVGDKIDWGIGLGQVKADCLPITDTCCYFVTKNVEAALQQLGSGLACSIGFGKVAVSGQCTVEADTADASITFVAGTALSISTNATADSVTFGVSFNDSGSGSTDVWSAAQIIKSENVPITAGESLISGQVVYIKSDGKAWKALADTTNPTYEAVGIVVDASLSANDPGHMQVNKTFTKTNILNGIGSKGDSIFLSSTVLGGYTNVAPSADNTVVKKIGVKESDNDLVIQWGLTILN